MPGNVGQHHTRPYQASTPYASQPHPHCPTPLKDRYLSALEACRALEKWYRNHTGEKGPIRFYECQCKGWHFTSHELKPGSDGVIHVR